MKLFQDKKESVREQEGAKKKKVTEIKNLLESDDVPEINKSCEHCAYLEGGKKF